MPIAFDRVRSTTIRGDWRKQGKRGRAAEVLVGFVAEEKRLGLLQQRRYTVLRQDGAGGIVGRVQHHDPGPLALCHGGERVHVVGVFRSERHWAYIARPSLRS